MRRLATASLALLVPLVLGVSCRGADAPPSDPGEVAADSDACRSFAALGSVSVGDAAGELRCSFDADSLEHRCETTTEDGRLSIVTEYASSADFVEAGRYIGKLTGTAETRSENGDVQRVSYAYDELGRLVRSVEVSRADRVVTRYSDYDDVGRPRRASAESSRDDGCAAWVSSIEYSAATRTVLRRSHPRDPGRCGFGERTRIERYDSAGNRASVEEADGAGVSHLFSARQVAATGRVCL
jgi:YD repeat-containing protein